MKLVTHIVVNALLVAAALKEATASATASANTATPAPKQPEKVSYNITRLYRDAGCSSPHMLSFSAVSASACSPCGASTSRTASSCKVPTCQSQTMTSCSNEYDLSMIETFSNSQYMTMVEFQDEKCLVAARGYAIALDGVCQQVGDQGLKASANADYTVTVSTYADSKCSRNPVMTRLVTSDNSGKCVGNVVVSALGVVIGRAPPPSYSVSSYFADDKCATQQALMVSAPIPGGMVGCVNATCSGGASTQCVDDPQQAVSLACAFTPCVHTKVFNTNSCAGTPYATVVLPVDGICRQFSGNYRQAVLNADKTVTVGSFQDAKCSKPTEDLVSVTSDNVDRCENNKIQSVKNLAAGKPSAKPSLGLVGSFTDDKCKTLNMYAVKVGAPGACKNAACSGRQTTACTDDLDKTVSSVTATKPFVQALQYTDDYCRVLAGGVVVPLDGQCHGMNGQFFKAVVNGDKTVTAGMYSDSKCAKVAQSTLVTSDNNGRCKDGWTVSVVNQKPGKGTVTPAPKPAPVPTPALRTNAPTPGPAATSLTTMTAKFTITSRFGENTCYGVPGVMLITPSTNSRCSVASCANQKSSACTDDFNKVVTTTFGTKPYVLINTYADDKCGNFTSGTVAVVDGFCRGTGGMYVKADQASGASVTVSYYSDSTCGSSALPAIKVTNATAGKCSSKTIATVGNIKLTK